MPTLFKSLSELLEKVEATKKRLEIINLTAEFLKELGRGRSGACGVPDSRATIPKWSQKTLDVSWATLSDDSASSNRG